MSARLEIRGLAHRTLEISEFALVPGQVMALVGPNGAGKSTLLQVLAGVLPPRAGTLVWEGQVLRGSRDLQRLRQRVTLVFQDPLLLDTTVRANVGMGLKLRGAPPAELRDRVQAEAERFGIAHLLDRSARKLSGGEGQRTALARALAMDPQVLLLDEAFASLDAPTREGLLDDLGRVLAETRTTVLLTTHSLDEALRLADHLAVLREGRLLQCGPVQEVLLRPRDPFVAGFLGMENVFQGQVVASGEGSFTLKVRGCALELAGEAPVGSQVTAGIRPEHITLLGSADGHPLASSARNRLPGMVVRIVPVGPFHRVELDADVPLSAFVTGHALEALDLRPGCTVVASFKATSIHVFRRH